MGIIKQEVMYAYVMLRTGKRYGYSGRSESEARIGLKRRIERENERRAARGHAPLDTVGGIRCEPKTLRAFGV